MLVERAPKGNFVVETRVRIDVPAEGCCFNYVQAGLVIYENDDSFVKLAVVSIWNTRQTEWAKEVPPGEPGFSRRPDLMIIERAARERVKAEGGLLRASEVLVVVEIVSPGSRRTDYVIKRGEYADAGIPHYWIVDITTPVSLVDCHLAGEFGYQEAPAVVAEFVTTEPCPITVHVDEL